MKVLEPFVLPMGFGVYVDNPHLLAGNGDFQKFSER